MTCLIVDDNKMARMAMAQLVEQVNGLVVAGECSTAIEAYQVIKKEAPDLLLLDVEMPDMSGLELVKNLGSKAPLIIFTTSKKDYAVEAFELSVIDYIVKPVLPARFLQAVEKAKEIFDNKNAELEIDAKDFVFIRDKGILKKINIVDILYLEAMGDYVKVYTAQKFHTVHNTLKSVEDKLPAQQFVRVHRSFIVALNKIDRVENGVIIINTATIPVADAYRSNFNKRLNLL